MGSSVSESELLAAYKQFGSVWKAAAHLGLCGQSVWERLKRLKIPLKYPKVSKSELEKIASFYHSGFQTGDGRLQAFAKSLGRTVPMVCRQAKSMNLTNLNRGLSFNLAQKNGARQSKYFRDHGHPRGFLGHHHTDEAKVIISKASVSWAIRATPNQKAERVRKMLATKYQKYGTVASQVKRGSWRAGHRTIGGKQYYLRSRWEANYAAYLEFLKQRREIVKWEYEVDVFWFEGIRRGTVCYKPDFKVTTLDGKVAYHEVKGWMDARSKLKLKRMKKYHPKVKIIVIDKTWFRSANQWGKLIPHWETKD